MRPRAEARGNTPISRVLSVPERRFNEASCRSTRKHVDMRAREPAYSCFNEASCRSTRKPDHRDFARRFVGPASMRPRAEARGNL